MHGLGGRTRVVINSWKEYRLCVKLLLRDWGLATVIRGDMDGGGCFGRDDSVTGDAGSVSAGGGGWLCHFIFGGK